MITLEEYLRDPCAKLSIPYWKAAAMPVPDGVRIVHDSGFSPEFLEGYEDQRYFRLYHDLQRIGPRHLDGFDLETAGPEDMRTIASIINDSYTDLRVSVPQLTGYTRTGAYRPELWVLVRETVSGSPAACAIADFDPQAGELSLEWVQVLPAYRGRGVGRMMVNELLHRGRAFARFATVSGQVDSPSRPERLYRRCGFVGDNVWHILRSQAP